MDVVTSCLVPEHQSPFLWQGPTSAKLLLASDARSLELVIGWTSSVPDHLSYELLLLRNPLYAAEVGGEGAGRVTGNKGVSLTWSSLPAGTHLPLSLRPESAVQQLQHRYTHQ